MVGVFGKSEKLDGGSITLCFKSPPFLFALVAHESERRQECSVKFLRPRPIAHTQIDVIKNACSHSMKCALVGPLAGGAPGPVPGLAELSAGVTVDIESGSWIAHPLSANAIAIEEMRNSRIQRHCSADHRRNRFGIFPRNSDSCSVLLEPKHLAFLCLSALAVSSCQHPNNAVSGTIEVDEVHVGPRSGGRVEKIFAWEGDSLRTGQPIVQLEATELKARRDLAEAQINTAIHDADAQQAQLEFLRDDAARQADLLKRKVVSPNDAERAVSAAKSQEKNVEAARMRVTQARAQLADIDAQLAEMQVIAPSDSILEVLSVKVGDVLPANREVATLLLTGHLWVRVFVPEPWLGHIKVGDHVRVRTDSFRDQDFDGVVEQVNRQAEFTPRNVQTVEDRIRQVFGVKIRLPNNDDRLRAGMAADVYFPNMPK